jgi:hypothetical protein
MRSAPERLQALRETARVRLLGLGERLEPLRHFLEALVARRAGEPGIHLGEFVGFAGDRGLQVLVGRTDRLPGGRVTDFLQEIEVAERVTGLGLGRVAKEPTDVGVALDVGAAGEIEVATVRLRLAGERFLEIRVGLRALQRLRHASSCTGAPGPGSICWNDWGKSRFE